MVKTIDSDGRADRADDEVSDTWDAQDLKAGAAAKKLRRMLGPKPPASLRRVASLDSEMGASALSSPRSKWDRARIKLSDQDGLEKEMRRGTTSAGDGVDLTRSQRTVWVGGIPSLQASNNAVRLVMAKMGEVVAVQIRVKDGVKKNWALVMYKTADAAERACSVSVRMKCGAETSKDWHCEPVDPGKFQSPEAQLAHRGTQRAAYALDTATSHGGSLLVERSKMVEEKLLGPVHPQETSLEEKLLAMQSSHQRAWDKRKAAEARENNAAARSRHVGDRLEIFSVSNQQWCPGKVVAIAGEEVQILYHTASRDDDSNTRTKWIPTNSSDLRNPPTYSSEIDASFPSVKDPTAQVQLSAESTKQKLPPHAKEVARRTLMRVPSARKKHTIKELVAWTYSCNAFSGLTLAQRRNICMEAKGVKTSESDAIVTRGDKSFGDSLTIIFDGLAAIYTTRKDKPADAIAPQPKRLSLKLQAMQRRRSVAAAPMLRRRSAALPMTMSLDALSSLPSLPEEGCVSSQLQQLPPAPYTARSTGSVMPPLLAAARGKTPSRRGSVSMSGRASISEDCGNSIPVKLELVDGDAVLPEIAFYNSDPVSIDKDGMKLPEHTILALADTTTMVIDNQQHIQWLRKSYIEDIDQKVRQLKQIPKYKDYESVPDLAKYCRRMWHPAGDVIVAEGDLADHVHYLIGGKVAIVKEAGTSTEHELDVITRGSCFGDWGVVNEELRTASCIARSEVEVLMIRGANFQALADEKLLSQIICNEYSSSGYDDVDEETDTDENPETNINETAKLQDYKKGNMEQSFKLISRRQIKKAGAVMKKETDRMCEESMLLPLAGVKPILAAVQVSTNLGSERVI
jgi:hypothetical protein